MTKAILLLTLALFAAQASSQGICTDYSAAGPTALQEAAPTWAALPCVPDTIGGTGKGYNVRFSSAGVVSWLWCPSGTDWTLRWGAMTWADTVPLAAELPAALLATDKRAALARLGEAHMGRNIDDPDLKALWCPQWAAMKASMPAADVWWVAKAHGNVIAPGTSPAYLHVNGAMVSTQQRVAQYTLCLPARVVIGSATWCDVTGDLWAVAAKRP